MDNSRFDQISSPCTGVVYVVPEHVISIHPNEFEAFAAHTDRPAGTKEPTDEQVQVKADSYRGYRIGKQALLVIIWICMGLAGEITGPTLIDLKDRLGVNYEQVSRVLIGKSVGMLIGSVMGGFLNERFYQQTELTLAVCLMLMAGAVVAVPYSRVLQLTATMLAVNGLTEGLINTGGNTLVMHLWGEHTASPMHSLHFGFGLGALIAPQVARPFLSPDAQSSSTPAGPAGMNITVTADQSRIEVAYGIIAGFVFVFSLVLLAFYIRGPPKGFKMHRPKSKFRDLISPGSCTGGYICYGVQLLICLCFYFIQAVGGERAYGKFLFSFAIESDIKMSKSDASNLQTAFWACFTLGRLLGVPTAKFVPVRFMMIGDIVGLLAITIILAIFGHSKVLVLWVCTCILGPLVSVVFPNGMSWANLKLHMNSMAVMVLMVGGSCGGFIYQYLTGHLFEQNPRNLVFVMVGYAVATLVVFTFMEVLAGIHGTSINRETEKIQEDKSID